MPITNVSNRELIISKLSIAELINKYSMSDDEGDNYILDGKLRVYLDFGEFTEEEDLPTIYPYSKAICQALILPVPKMNSKEVTYDELKSIASERGMGMLGSSNK